MGFSSVTSQLIMFIAVMSLSTGLIVVFKNYVDESSGAMTSQWDTMSNNIKTDITITNVNWNNDTNTTTVHVLNTGKTTLDIEKTDIYLDGQFIPRSALNRTINVTPSTDTRSVGLWDPKELVEIKIFKGLGSDTHYVDVSTQFGIKDTETFST